VTSESDLRQSTTETVPRAVSRRTYRGSHWRSPLSRWLRAQSFLVAGVLTGVAMVVLGLVLPSPRHDGVVAPTETVPRTLGRRTHRGNHWRSPLSRWLRAETFLVAGVLAAIAIVVLGLVLPSSRYDGVVAPPPDASAGAHEHRSGKPSPSTPANQPAPDMLVSPSPTTTDMPAALNTPADGAGHTTQNATTSPTSPTSPTSVPVNCANSLQRPGPASYYRTFTCPTDAGGGYGNRYTGLGRRTRYR
jgi:hypothetical protein